MREQDVFVLADETLLGVVEQIGDEQWTMTMPAWFDTRDPTRAITLREVINYHAYEDAWVPDMLAGRTMDEVGRDAFGADPFGGDLLGDDPKASYARIVAAATAAARSLDDLDRTVHTSFGDYPAHEYFWQINGFRGLRANDIARAIGVDRTLPPELVQGLWDEISPHAEEWRTIGIFRERVDVPDDAPLQDRLLGLTGRQP